MLTPPVRAIVAVGAIAASIFACVDLFHDTDMLQSEACPDGSCKNKDDADAPAPAAVLCENDAGDAVEVAKNACAWLGACAGSYGINEPGTCMFEALRAYDCKLDPFNAPKDERAAFWSCLRKASESRSCADVARCVFPQGTHRCDATTDRFACPDVSPTAGANRFVRVFCRAGANTVAGGENCAAVGGRCMVLGSAPAYQGCSTDLPSNDAPSCSGTTCESGNTLRVCSSNEDGGVLLAELECSQLGAERCGSGNVAGPGCIGLKLNSDSSCGPDQAPSCSGTRASRCSNAVFEDVDCARVGLGCDADGAVQTHQACKVVDDADGGDAGPPCTADCESGNVRACMRGATTVITCSQRGLGECRKLTDADGRVSASCSPPAN